MAFMWVDWMHRLLVATVLFAAPLAAQTITTDTANHSITPDMRTLPLHIGGRVQPMPLPLPMPKGATAYRHDWPGIYFEGAFVGDRVALKFDDASHEYRLFIDDAAPITLFRPGKVEVTIGGLARKAHRLRLEQVAESFLGAGSFEGFYIARDARPLTVKPRRRQIEFIGPSGMAGFGARSLKPECSFDELARTSDTQQAYTVLTAKHFDADYQTNLSSGHGLIRNVKEARDGPGLIFLHDRTLVEEPAPYSDHSWQPQIIVIQGIVDIAIGDPETGEKWATVDALWADWLAAYRGFIADLHRRSPHAALILEWPDAETAKSLAYRVKLEAARQALADEAHRDGVRVILFSYPDWKTLTRMEQTGCDHHPSLADHRLFADWLERLIDAHPGIWDGK